MKRREFITLLGGVITAWPIATRAQQVDRIRRVGIMPAGLENDPGARARLAQLIQGLQKAGWTEGRNVRTDYRWGAVDSDTARAAAAELVALEPDVIFVVGAPSVAAVRQ